jgi:hypothetical protein
MYNDYAGAFIEILSRYIGVSHVYFEKTKTAKASFNDQSTRNSCRQGRLFNFFEGLSIPETRAANIVLINEEDSAGQNLVPTEENLVQIKKYQEIVKGFLAKNPFSDTELRNKNKIVKLLEADPKTFLSSFSSVTYAWDVLVELSCLSFLPLTEKLTSRDLIYMHSIELIQHIARLYIRMTRMNPNKEINLSGRFTVDELEQLHKKGLLVEIIIGSSNQKSVREQINELYYFSEEEEEIKKIINSLIDKILPSLIQVEDGFTDMLKEDISMIDAERICNDIVSFGIAIGYSTWFSIAKNDKTQREMLMKHYLFCTRYLLEERRWEICKNVSNLCRQMIYSINALYGDENIHNKAYMVEANNFFARKKLGETISDEIKAWDISKVHKRYEFIQRILLDLIDDETVSLAKKLLMPEKTGRPNMSIHEFTKWPILEAFRNSGHWKEFETYANNGQHHI